MKKLIAQTIFIALLFFVVSCKEKQQNTAGVTTTVYVPDSQALYDSIVTQDSLFFSAYNSCDLEKQATIYSDSIEFYHDQSGLSTSKQALLDATKKNVCGKVTRELIKGSIEVYAIKGYGAVEMGLHQFHNSQEKNDKPHASKFVIVWKRTGTNWEITRVISLH